MAGARAPTTGPVGSFVFRVRGWASVVPYVGRVAQPQGSRAGGPVYPVTGQGRPSSPSGGWAPGREGSPPGVDVPLVVHSPRLPRPLLSTIHRLSTAAHFPVAGRVGGARICRAGVPRSRGWPP